MAGVGNKKPFRQLDISNTAAIQECSSTSKYDSVASFVCELMSVMLQYIQMSLVQHISLVIFSLIKTHTSATDWTVRFKLMHRGNNCN